ncbi:hypothetical protein FMN50_00010, partial [Rhodobacterales bacterium]
VTVLNKIDLPAAEPDRIKEQIEDVIGIDASEACMISAKTGLGGDHAGFGGVDPDHILDLFLDAVGFGRRQVDLVEDGD